MRTPAGVLEFAGAGSRTGAGAADDPPGASRAADGIRRHNTVRPHSGHAPFQVSRRGNATVVTR